MKISKLWLDKFFDTPLPSAEVLADTLTFHVFEIDGIDKVGSDDVLDVKVTPNRGHDALSHRGIAKELSAILQLPLAHDPFVSKSDISKKTDAITVKIDTPLCKRYIAGYVKGVKVGPSPTWLKERLEAVGQRSINNVVDATNFVMFNTGQPLHAFDAAKLGSLQIGVRAARGGEVLVALDAKEYALTESNIVITAGDTPVGIAGVKGGSPAAIDESTVDIVIESANFDGVSVRKTAQALKLRTDASARFEQGLSPELAARGMEGMVEFVAHMLGGTVEGFVDVYPEPQQQTYVAVTVDKINSVLGIELTGADVAGVFTRLGFAYKEEQGVFEVQPPFERLDITIAEDLVEEVVRIIGYDKVTGMPLPALEHKPAVNKNFYHYEAIREFLTSQGFSEVCTSVFSDAGERVVLNKVDGVKPYLRESLPAGLTEALERNVRNKDILGVPQVKLFEIGTVWKGGKEEITYELAVEPVKKRKSAADYKQALEAYLATLPKEQHEYQSLPLSTTERYQSFSKYPYIVRDISTWVPAEQEGSVAKDIFDACDTGHLIQKVSLIDTFTKDGKTSVLYRLIFQSFERTLTEAEVQGVMERIYTELKAKGFEIR